MTAINIRPNSSYIYSANWQEIHVLTKHWQSDIEFYFYELKFLLKLTNTYLLWLNDDGNIGKVKKVQKDLNTLLKEHQQLEAQLQLHLKHVNALLENAFIYDEHTFKDEHFSLENSLTAYTKNLKRVKKSVFTCTETVLNSENLSI